MKAIKKINNNSAICIDDNGNELVAFGKGIGFPNVPYDIEDLSIIQNTFYHVDMRIISILEDIDIEIINISQDILRKYSTLENNTYSSNMLFSLSDHINFAISRTKQGISLKSPLHYEVQHRFELEYSIGMYGLKLVKDRLKVHLPAEEASNIALHLINSADKNNCQSVDREYVISQVIKIIDNHFNISIDLKSFNYARFHSHFSYLLDRIEKSNTLNSENQEMYKQFKEKYIEVHDCCVRIDSLLYQHYKYSLSNEEIFYLIIHLNRLCIREEKIKG